MSSVKLLIYVEKSLDPYLVYYPKSLAIPNAIHIFGRVLSLTITMIGAKQGPLN